MTRELSLFTGAGGGLLGTRLLGWEPCGYVEWNEYCQRVLAARIRDGFLRAAPIFNDVREFVQSGAAEQYRGIADVVTAGFPCQPFSVAGKQAGADDERNMWPATADVIRIVRPESVLLENVPGLVSTGYIGTVIADLAALGYVGRWGVIGAVDAGAPHKRDRLWIVAHARGQRHRGAEEEIRAGRNAAESCGQNMADTESIGREVSDSAHFGAANREINASANPGGCADLGRWWRHDPAEDVESPLGRMADELADGLERLQAIGNGQVPTVVVRAWRELAA